MVAVRENSWWCRSAVGWGLPVVADVAAGLAGGGEDVGRAARDAGTLWDSSPL